MSLTLDALTSQADASVTVTGATSPTFDALTSTASGTVDITADSAVTLDPVTSASASASDLAGADTADPVNIAGWTFAFKVKRQDADPDPSLVTASISIVDAAAGQVRTTGTAAELDNLIGDYRFALWRTNAGAKVPLRTGYFSVVDTVQS